MKVKIMVAAHKEFQMPSDTKLYLPVLVGATRNYKKGINYQRDDEGTNISVKNPYYSELTALYWAWKNLDAEAVGLVHYRRFLSLHRKCSLSSILNENEINGILKKVSIILPKKRNYYIESNYSHYIHAHHKEPLDMTRKVIQEKYPEYVEFFDKVMVSNKAHMFNMFIMKRALFNNYVSWLFSILFEVEANIDISDYSKQESRVFGYLSELLLDVWLEKNQIKYYEVNWIQLGKKSLIKKMFYFMIRKFGFSLKTHF
ncbi:DUF4422 domain-containing protein [Pediococcus inopinatus]|uniref:DUF4422 domain-containing protein n=1 Tax=Pediococcus inopinatus TaxID=114090 RepID=UPI002A69F1F7|nr:DUF4422 domain-containing protein [Pediococcus inopinatus]WPP08691.1 DUF4422 domain-containing protein [Pediococcus inopinatus]